MAGDPIDEVLPKLCFPYLALGRMAVVLVSNPNPSL